MQIDKLLTENNIKNPQITYAHRKLLFHSKLIESICAIANS